VPEPTSRERKRLRGPKHVPGGPIDEPVRARCDEPPPPELLRAIEQFERGEYFEQHETLENLWRATRAPVRDLYHGILQIGVGLHHLRRRNHHGATVLLEEGIRRLEPFAPACQRIQVDALLRAATSARRRLIELGPERIAEFDWSEAPRVRLLP
jgi:predicted metal-dependent hydrolase